jgi:hypothetical protein
MTASKAGDPTRLPELLALKLAGKIGYQAFCDDFEHAYNFEIGQKSLTLEEDEIFRELFDVVAWFTADESARNELPTHFKDEAAVEAAIQRAQARLEHSKNAATSSETTSQ